MDVQDCSFDLKDRQIAWPETALLRKILSTQRGSEVGRARKVEARSGIISPRVFTSSRAWKTPACSDILRSY